MAVANRPVATTDDDLHALLQAAIGRNVKTLSHRAVLFDAMDLAYLTVPPRR